MNTEITTWSQIPTKTEIAETVNQIDLSNAVEYYVKLKALEEFVKQGLSKLKKPAIEQFLTQQEGIAKGQILGATIQVIGESKTVTRERYTYSEQVDKFQNEIEQIEFDLKLKKENLKLMQTLEINQGIAIKEMFDEVEPENYSLRITLNK